MSQTLEHLQSPPQRWIDSRGARIPHWKIGQGPDLLFIHGWPLDSRTWREVVDELSRDFTCHLIDLPGAGQSVWDAQVDASIQGISDIVTDVIRSLDVPHVGLIGQDSGGSFARIAAAACPDKVSGLVLANTEIPGHHPWRLKALFPIVRARYARPLMQYMARRRFGQYLLLRDSMSERARMHGEFAELFFMPLGTHDHVFKGAQLLPLSIGIKDFDVLADAHPRITCDVHLVWGEDDPWFPLHKCREMCESFAGEVTLATVPGAKLLVYEEHPKRFAQEVFAHFKGTH